MGGAKRPGRDQRREVAGEAGDVVDTRGLNRLGEGHGRQNGGERPRQHRLARALGPTSRLWSERLQKLLFHMDGCPDMDMTISPRDSSFVLPC